MGLISSFRSTRSTRPLLLQFTIGVLARKRRMCWNLQAFYSWAAAAPGWQTLSSQPALPECAVVMAEHLLMTVTIAPILYHGFRRCAAAKQGAGPCHGNGYVLFAVCSILAITIYYLDSSLPYSPVYMLGIFGSSCCWLRRPGSVLEQINENANMAVYAKLAYRDVLTGLGNRAAFCPGDSGDQTVCRSFGYIMVDVNDLKR